MTFVLIDLQMWVVWRFIVAGRAWRQLILPGWNIIWLPANWTSAQNWRLEDHALKTFLFSFYYRIAHAARLGFFYKNALYKFTVIIIIILKFLNIFKYPR